jgi:hypothetical protein
MLKWWIHRQEHVLMSQDTNREVQPFQWGLEHITGDAPSVEPREFLHTFVKDALSNSESFFNYPSSTPCFFKDGQLTFPSPIVSPYPENNLVRGRLFPAESNGRAVIVLPQWNADAQSHVALCRLLNRVNLSALRLCLPYHEERKPPHLQRADYLIGPNVGLTIQACRQAVLESRMAADWLMAQGYHTLGIIGTSIGSCIAFLTFAHDDRFQVGVFNHASSYFADVVWTGLTTQHVRQGIEPYMPLDELRTYWSPISPQAFVYRLHRTRRKSLMISARYDLSFLPHLTQLFYSELERWGVPFDTFSLPCGHYTSGKFPFNYLDGVVITNFFRKHLI